ncbi:MAG: hypothetical protein N3G21_11510 [Candidatus Hydrogenedentes bacterium]|nr:hypothetical protein [Candidatus Hydrogenedentota bacterium]
MLPLRVQISDFIFREIMNLKVCEGTIVEERGVTYLKVGTVKLPILTRGSLPPNSLVKFSINTSGHKKQLIIHSWIKMKEVAEDKPIVQAPKTSGYGNENFIEAYGESNKLQSMVSQILKMNLCLKIKAEEISNALKFWFDKSISLGVIIDRLESIFRKLEKEGVVGKDVIDIFNTLYEVGKFSKLEAVKKWFVLSRESLEFIKKLFDLGEEIVKEGSIRDTINRAIIIRLLSECKNEDVLKAIKKLGLEREIKTLVETLEGRLLSSQFLRLLSVDRYIYAFEIPVFDIKKNWVKVYLNLDSSKNRDIKNLGYDVVAISMDLEKMGRIWIELRSFANSFFCLIKTEKEKSYKAFIDKIDELKNRLCSLGVSKVDIRVDKLSEDETECFWNMLNCYQGTEVQG